MAATANRYDLRRVKESSWGDTPNNPALTFVRNTGESLSNSLTTERSQEIRPDRTTADLIVTDASVGGAFEFELSYGSFDDFIEAALMSAWVDAGVTTPITTTTAATSNLTGTGVGANAIAGQLIELRGADTPANNRVYRVVDVVDSDTLTVTPIPSAAETSAGASTVGSYVRNGTVEQSFTLVKRFNDASPVTTQSFQGMRVTGFTLDMSTASLITGSFNFLGAQATWGTNPAFPGETSLAAPTTPVMNAVTNITDINMDGVGLCATGAVSSLTFELDNQHREQKGLCRLGNVGVVAGQLAVNVSGSQYFTNAVEAQKFENSDAFEFSFNLVDNLGNTYNFFMPKNKYETFDVNASGLDTDVMAETSFTGLFDENTGVVIVISRIPAAVSGGTT